MDEAPDIEGIGPLKLLRQLVTVLTVVMILGFIVLIGLLVTRFPKAESHLPLPDAITLPEGTNPVAFTQADAWYAVVTDDNRILVFARDSGDLIQTVEIAVGN